MNDKVNIHGQFWSAGDNVYIDVRNENGWECVCLNELMKRNIKENATVDIEITVDDSKLLYDLKK